MSWFVWNIGNCPKDSNMAILKNGIGKNHNLSEKKNLKFLVTLKYKWINQYRLENKT